MKFISLKNYSSKALPFIIFISAIVFFSSCSKKDKTPDSSSNNSAKITVSVSNGFNKAEGDDFDLSVGASTGEGGSVDWKVNGETVKGAVATIGTDDVDGGKDNMTMESIQKFLAGSVNIGAYNISGKSFTIKYKIELNGKVLDEQSVEVKSTDADVFTKVYQLK